MNKKAYLINLKLIKYLACVVLGILLIIINSCKPIPHLLIPVKNKLIFKKGAIVQGDTTKKSLTLVFTGHEFADGADHITQVLNKQKIKAAFFFTGDFYRNKEFKDFIIKLHAHGHYLGAHSDKHLLYCDWNDRDRLLLTHEVFMEDLEHNYVEMRKFGVKKKNAPFFLPPFEWYNETIGTWSKEYGLQLINYTVGTRSNADYTTPKMTNYQSSEKIYESIVHYESDNSHGLNGFILLIHIGTDPERTDKFYYRLEELILYLKEKGYQFETIFNLLAN